MGSLGHAGESLAVERERLSALMDVFANDPPLSAASHELVAADDFAVRCGKHDQDLHNARFERFGARR